MDAAPAAELISHMVISLMAIAIGFFLSKRVPRPRTSATWVAWVATVFVAGYVGVNIALISVFGIAVYLNALLQGLGFGVLLGLLIRKE